MTGHRTLPVDPALAAGINGAVQRIRALVPASPFTPVQLAVLSALAEGADRLVARIVLEQPGATLEVVLPLPADEYLRDFDGEPSRREFKALVGRAGRVVTVSGASSRDEAYEEAGLAVVSQCDALIAVWDGQPARGRGGTAEVVEAAQESGLPVFRIDSAPPFQVTELYNARLALGDFHQLDVYNREALQADLVAADCRRAVERCLSSASRASLDPDALRPFVTAIMPHYVRADRLAIRCQQQFLGLSAMLLVLPVLAVVSAVVQALWWQGWLLSILEGLLLTAALVMVQSLRRSGTHERWLSYRFFAERVRSSIFVMLAETSAGRERKVGGLSIVDARGGWPERALSVVKSACPPPSDLPLDGVKQLLIDAWIDDQRRYQDRTHHRLQGRHRAIGWATAGVFGLTLLAALLHGLFEQVPVAPANEGLLTSWLTLVVIAMPAVGGAMSAFAEEREYRRHAMRSLRMANRLAQLRVRMARATSLDRVRAIAAEAETLMLSENHDWFTAMQFHEAELHP